VLAGLVRHIIGTRSQQVFTLTPDKQQIPIL